MDGVEESEQVSSRRAKRVGKAIMVKEEDCGDGARMQAYRGLKREGVVQDKVEREKKSVADERESRIARISSKVRCARWRATMSRSPVRNTKHRIRTPRYPSRFLSTLPSPLSLYILLIIVLSVLMDPSARVSSKVVRALIQCCRSLIRGPRGTCTATRASLHSCWPFAFLLL